jgi:hypothetical protein
VAQSSGAPLSRWQFTHHPIVSGVTFSTCAMPATSPWQVAHVTPARM